MKFVIVTSLVIHFFLGVVHSCAQVVEAKYSTYWQQRASLFEMLPDGKKEILFLGDSITDGGEWQELFNNKKVKNRGISGDITDGVLDRLDEVISARPRKIFLLIGINDLSQGKTVDYVVENIKRIISTLQSQSPKTEVFLESILPVNPAFEKFPNHTNKTAEIIAINQMLQKYADDTRIFYIDLHSHFSDEDNMLKPEYTNDGLHLTGQGYLLWKALVDKYCH